MSESSPEIPSKSGQQEKKENPWDPFGKERLSFSRTLLEIYNAQDFGDLPDAVFDAVWNEYCNLTEEQSKNFDSGDTAAQEATAKKMEAFLDEQRAKAKEIKKEATPASEPEPQPPQTEASEEDWNKLTEKKDKEEETPAGWRQKLREVITGAAEKTTEMAKGTGEFFKEKTGYLTARSKELGEKIKAFDPKIEKNFRSWGEKYNKLSTREKIGIGIALGLGTGALLGVSLPLALVGFTGIAAQRTAGLASMFLKYEKSSSSKERAMLKAIGYQAGISVGMLGLVWGVKEGIEHHEAIFEWLKNIKEHGFFGHAENAPATATPPSSLETTTATVPTTTHAPETTTTSIPQTEAPPSPAPIFETPVSAPESSVIEMPKIPEISVNASRGHGYEYMLKRLWEQLQNKNLDPDKYAADSDIQKLLLADAGSIDKVVHQIASDPKHGFFHADGTSVRISPDAQMNIDADGEVHIYTGDVDVIHAPEGAPVTPAYHPEAHLSEPESEVASAPPAEPSPAVAPPPTPPAPPAEVPASPVETPAPPAARPSLQAEHHPNYGVTDSAGHPVVDSEGFPVHASSVEQHAPTSSAAPEAHTFMTKMDHIPINPKTPAIYQVQTLGGETYFAAYGGSDEARFKYIQDFLLHPENQGKTIRFAHSVPSILGPRIQVDELGAQTAVGHTSWFPSFFKEPVAAPDPKDFQKLIK